MIGRQRVGGNGGAHYTHLISKAVRAAPHNGILVKKEDIMP